MSGSSAPGYLGAHSVENRPRQNVYDGIRPGYRPVLSLKEMEKMYPNEYAFWLMLKEVMRTENGVVTRLQIQTMTQVIPTIKQLHLVSLPSQNRQAMTLFHFCIVNLNLDEVLLALGEKFGFDVQDQDGWTPILYLINSHEIRFENKIGPIEEHFKNSFKVKTLIRTMLAKSNLVRRVEIKDERFAMMNTLEFFIHARGRNTDLELFKDIIKHVQVQDKSLQMEAVLWRIMWYFATDVLKNYHWRLKELDFKFTLKENGRTLLFALLRNVTVKDRKDEAVDFWFRFVQYIEKHAGETEFKQIIQKPDAHKVTLLMHACRGGQVPVVKFILKWYESINQRDDNGRNCLDYAIDGQQPDIVQLLIQTDHWESVLCNAVRTAIPSKDRVFFCFFESRKIIGRKSRQSLLQLLSENLSK